MLDDWFRTIELRITIDEFHRLPRAAGYKHEYFGGRCVLTPRPRCGYAALDLGTFRPLRSNAWELNELTIRPVEDPDWEELGPLCGAAFHRVPPFSSLSDDERGAAGGDCMAHARAGGDGPLVPAASMVAVDHHGTPRGALLVVLKPAGYRKDPWRVGRAKPAGGDSVPRPPRATQAHLDWVFVSPWFAGRGVASALLAGTVRALRAAGHKTLTSAFLIGNGESMAWHWRNGFELLQYPGSFRRVRR